MGSDDTANGIALCALHHRAYDRALVTLNENYQIILNEKALQELRSQGMAEGEDVFVKNLRAVIHVPPTVSDRPNVGYVKSANALRGWV